MVGWNHSTRDVSYTLALVFCFNATATTEIYTYRHTLSLHDALPICRVPDIIKELREYGIEPLVYDPVVDPEEAEEEFGIKLVGADAMEGLDSIVFCVPHREILNALNPCPTKRLVDGGIFVDVKSALEPAGVSQTIRYWSL